MTGVSAAIMWLVVLVVFMVVEATSMQLVSVWFCIGSFFAMIAGLLNVPFIWQLLIFFIFSLIALILLRPYLKKKLEKTISPTNTDALIGRTAIVIETIDNDEGIGLAKVWGQEWTARSEDNRIIEKGAKATVVRIEGVRLYLK